MSTKARVKILIGILVVIAVLLAVTRHKSSSGGLRIAFGAEFLTRPDGYSGLSNHYGFRFASEPKQMLDGLMYKALTDGTVDVINAFSTDGRIPAYNLFCLKDDKNFFPPYYAAPLVRKKTLAHLPELENILNRLGGVFSNEVMQKLNFQVDEEGLKAGDVARKFLAEAELIEANAKPGDGSAGLITVGSKEFTEQEILGEIIAILIECNSNIKVVRKLNLGGTIICFNALKAGDLDIYAEYTGTGLVNILKADVQSDPKKTYDIVKKEFAKRYDLIWLKPLGFNNTYTLTMRKEHANRLGIKTTSDLADFVKGRTKQ